jgi:magnesium chelatase family protein
MRVAGPAGPSRRVPKGLKAGTHSYLNATLPSAMLDKVAALDDESQKLIESAVNRLGLSARAFNKVLRVARPVADLDGEELVRAGHRVRAALAAAALHTGWN